VCGRYSQLATRRMCFGSDAWIHRIIQWMNEFIHLLCVLHILIVKLDFDQRRHLQFHFVLHFMLVPLSNLVVAHMLRVYLLIAAFLNERRRDPEEIQQEVILKYKGNLQDIQQKNNLMSSKIRGQDTGMNDQMNKMVWNGKAAMLPPAPTPTPALTSPADYWSDDEDDGESVSYSDSESESSSDSESESSSESGSESESDSGEPKKKRRKKKKKKRDKKKSKKRDKSSRKKKHDKKKGLSGEEATEAAETQKRQSVIAVAVIGTVAVVATVLMGGNRRQ
jgi:hypothetical protein